MYFTCAGHCMPSRGTHQQIRRSRNPEFGLLLSSELIVGGFLRRLVHANQIEYQAMTHQLSRSLSSGYMLNHSLSIDHMLLSCESQAQWQAAIPLQGGTAANACLIRRFMFACLGDHDEGAHGAAAAVAADAEQRRGREKPGACPFQECRHCITQQLQVGHVHAHASPWSIFP